MVSTIELQLQLVLNYLGCCICGIGRDQVAAGTEIAEILHSAILLESPDKHEASIYGTVPQRSAEHYILEVGGRKDVRIPVDSQKTSWPLTLS